MTGQGAPSSLTHWEHPCRLHGMTHTDSDTLTCFSCWQDFGLADAHDADACHARTLRAEQDRLNAYAAGLPCCEGLDDHGHKGCRSDGMGMALAKPRKDCVHYCTVCVPTVRATAREEAAAEAMFRVMRVVRTPWAELSRQGQDHYRKAAKAALKAADAAQ